MASITDEFISFLQEYGVMGLALAVVVGNATKDLVNAIVADIIMPIVEVALPGGNWREAVFTTGPVTFQVGHLISALLDFFIIAFLVYAFVKYALKKENVAKI